jgi:PAT family acetyl-CoA transporter-like MFS transporter 1
MTLAGYLRFWCLMSYGVTLWLIFFKKEASLMIYVLICLDDHFLQDKEVNKDEMSIKAVYKTIWNICKLPRISSFIFNR